MATYYKNNKTFVEKRNNLGEILSIDSILYDVNNPSIQFYGFLRFGNSNDFLSVMYKGYSTMTSGQYTTIIADSVDFHFSIYSADQGQFVQNFEKTIFTADVNFESRNDSSFVLINQAFHTAVQNLSFLELLKNGELNTLIPDVDYNLCFGRKLFKIKEDTLLTYCFENGGQGFFFSTRYGINFITNTITMNSFVQTEIESNYFYKIDFFDKNKDTLFYAYSPASNVHLLSFTYYDENLDIILQSPTTIDLGFDKLVRSVSFKNGKIYVILYTLNSDDCKLLIFNNSFNLLCQFDFSPIYHNQNYYKMEVESILGSSYISFNDDFTKKLFFIDDCNSISELKLEKKEIELVKIYPNPAHNELNVELSGDDNFYEILSLDGKILKSDLLVNNKINVSNLENGIYLLNLDNSNVIRFVKN